MSLFLFILYYQYSVNLLMIPESCHDQSKTWNREQRLHRDRQLVQTLFTENHTAGCRGKQQTLLPDKNNKTNYSSIEMSHMHNSPTLNKYGISEHFWTGKVKTSDIQQMKQYIQCWCLRNMIKLNHYLSLVDNLLYVARAMCHAALTYA